MIRKTPGSRLHLPTLTVAGFRGIRELSIGRLGRVTLLTGNNAVGKTTVLEAVRVFAARGRHSVLSALLRDRDEYTTDADDDDHKIRALDFDALFFGRRLSEKRIAIGPVAPAHQLTIEEVPLADEQLSLIEGPDTGVSLGWRHPGADVSLRGQGTDPPVLLDGRGATCGRPVHRSSGSCGSNPETRHGCRQ